MHFTNVYPLGNIGWTAFVWIVILGVAGSFLAIMLELFRNVFVNWGFSHPVISSITAMIGGLILWWSFGGLISLAAPRSSEKTSIVGQKHLTFSEMTNPELREGTVKFANWLRKFSSDYRQTADELSMKEWSDFNAMVQKIPEAERETPERQQRIMEMQGQVVARMKSRSDDFADSFRANYLIDAQLLDKELRKRVNIQALITDPGSGPLIPKGKPAWALEGKLAGPDPVGDLANYLESLAKQLTDN